MGFSVELVVRSTDPDPAAEGAGRGKARHVADLCDEDRRGDRADAVQAEIA